MEHFFNVLVLFIIIKILLLLSKSCTQLICQDMLYSNNNLKHLVRLPFPFFLTLRTTYMVENTFLKPSKMTACLTQSKGAQVAQDKFQRTLLKYIGTDSDRNTRNLLRHSQQVIAA